MKTNWRDRANQKERTHVVKDRANGRERAIEIEGERTKEKESDQEIGAYIPLYHPL